MNENGKYIKFYKKKEEKKKELPNWRKFVLINFCSRNKQEAILYPIHINNRNMQLSSF